MLATGFPQADAENDFMRARRHQVLAALAHRMSHRPAGSNRLIPLDEAIGDLGRRGERRLGLQTIALDTVVGSVDSRRDFDRRFRPTTDRVRPRWERLALAERRGQPVPPIEVYRVGGLHFVSDGHHRVSVAVAAGRPVIDAYVTEILTATPPQEPGIAGTSAAQKLRHCEAAKAKHAAGRSGSGALRDATGRCGPEDSGWPCHRSKHLKAGSRRAPCGHYQQGRCRKPPNRDSRSPSVDSPAAVDHIARSRPGSRSTAPGQAAAPAQAATGIGHRDARAQGGPAHITARSQTAAASRDARAVTQPELGRLGLALTLAASFMVVLDFSIVNVALPSIQRDLGISAGLVQWVVTAYAIAFGGLLILGGRAGDLYGRRRMFLAGLALFTGASLAGGLARDPLLLIASRVMQGTGAALVAPAALSMITTGFPEGLRRTRALGLYGATASVGFVAGQILGGVLVEYLSWRAVFLVNVPVGMAALAVALRMLTESRLSRVGRLDTAGAVLITTAVAALVFAVSQVGVAGPGSASTLVPLGLSVLAGAGFAAAERRHADPLIRPGLLRVGGLRSATILMLLLGLWNGGEMLVLSVYLQQVLHLSPLASGLVIAPQGIIGFTAGLFGARLTGRLGIYRILVLAGLAATAGFLILTQLPAGGGYNPLLAAVMLVGFGTAGTAFAAVVIASAGITDADQGMVGGMINTSRQLGAAIGAALLPAVADALNRAGLGMAMGDRAAMLTGAIAAGLATLVALTARESPTPGTRTPDNPAPHAPR